MHAFIALSLLIVAADPLPEGKSSVELKFGSVPIEVFAYKPKGYVNGPLIMVFHGVLRNAEEYRDDSIEMGERFRALILAPRFDDEQFPKRKYQFGGIVEEGKAVPQEQRTGEYVNRIYKSICEKEGRSEIPLYLIGHSGGGQFLVRLAAFVKTDAKRIVASNAGTYLFPDRVSRFPFGYGGLPNELQSDEQLKAYLAQPLTLYLGTEDTERDEYLDVTPEADAQGPVRFERGKNAFAFGKKLADERNWEFGWKLVIANGIEHDHTKMFNHPQCSTALELKKPD